MTETEPVDLASHPKRRQNFYKLAGLSQDELVVIEAIEMAEFKLRQRRQRNIRWQEMRAGMLRVRAWFGWINVAMIACVIVIVTILLAGCQGMFATPGERHAEALRSSGALEQPAAWRPGPSYWSQLGASRTTRTIHCSTMTGGRITTTRCR